MAVVSRYQKDFIGLAVEKGCAQPLEQVFLLLHTMIWDILPYTSGFQQRLVTWRGTGTGTNNQFIPKIFTLAAGPHQLIICGREANAQLETITILGVPQAPQGLHITGR